MPIHVQTPDGTVLNEFEKAAISWAKVSYDFLKDFYDQYKMPPSIQEDEEDIYDACKGRLDEPFEYTERGEE